MIRVHDVILSEDIATAKFACNITLCRGACCVIADAGAPDKKEEIPVLNKAWKIVEDRVSADANRRVEERGVVFGRDRTGYEMSCVDSGGWVFVEKDENGVATCAIQSASF